MANELCPKCGSEMDVIFGDYDDSDSRLVCPLGPEQCELMAILRDGVVPHADLKAAHTRIAELEQKLAEADLREENILAVLPEDFSAVEYIKHLAAANAALEEKLGDAEGALRAMASYVGNGGYNADTVDPKVFEAKIREGIDFIIRVEVNRALSDADTRAHAWWAHTGPHKSLREAIHNGTPAWVREPEASRKKGAEHGE